jgi:hypothetical protein
MYLGGGIIIDVPTQKQPVRELHMSTSWYASSLDGAPGEAVLPSKDATLHSGTAYSLACVAVALNHLAGVIRVLTGTDSIALLGRSSIGIIAEGHPGQSAAN